MVSVAGIVSLTKSIIYDVINEMRKWSAKKKNRQGVLVFIVFVIILAVMFKYQAVSIQTGGKAAGAMKSPEELYKGWTTQEASETMEGDVSENSGVNESITISNVNLAKVTFTLTWEDEPDHDFRHENTPDELSLSVEAPNGENKSASGQNPQGGQGVITLEFELVQHEIDGTNGTGDWNITVSAGECGDQMPKRFGIIKFIDDGNSWTLEVKWEYYTKSEVKE